MGNRVAVRMARASLTEDERLALLRRCGRYVAVGARIMRISEQTYAEAISPGGMLLPATVARIRAWLEAGPIDPDTGEVVHG